MKTTQTKVNEAREKAYTEGYQTGWKNGQQAQKAESILSTPTTPKESVETTRCRYAEDMASRNRLREHRNNLGLTCASMLTQICEMRGKLAELELRRAKLLEEMTNITSSLRPRP